MRKSLLLIFVFLLASAAFAQFTDDAALNRWLKKKPVISAIEVEGNNYFPDSKIKSVMFSRKGNILRTIKSDRRRRVQRETIIHDTSEVKYIYLSSGFLGIRIKETFEPIPPDSGALVKITIDEGRRFYYGKITLSGPYDVSFKRELFGITSRFKANQPADPFKLKQALYDCKSVLANNGYPYAAADCRIDTTLGDSTAAVEFIVSSDSLVHFGRVHLIGVGEYDSSLVRRGLTIKSGEIYRRRDIIESQKRLLITGNYLTLQLYAAEKDTANVARRLHPDFILNLKEKKAQYVSIQTGAGQNPYKDLIWDFSLAWGKRNFLRSRRLEISTSSSFVVFTEWRVLNHSYRLQVTEPWFLGLRMPMTLTGRIEPGVRSAVQPYRIQTWSVSLETNWEPQYRFKIYTGLEYKSVNIYGLSLADQIKLRQERGITVRRKLYINISRDARDHPFVPAAGSLTGFRLEYAGGFLGGDESFVYSETSWGRYQKLWPGWILATRIKIGYVREFGASKSVPIDVRFYTGGANSIRGFVENGLGPQSKDGTPEGANVLLIANQEFRYPIIGKFWGSLFSDIGNGFRDWADIKPTSLAIAYGIGLQFISPAGPIRVDYARRVRTKTIDSGHRFHFTILYAF
ncbi:MAG: BamA/TamA family outer membrane protein [candidate division Zixibacteria bacterium]|nr:BamA/TamA family outer membrane protein [candidate division Zixibacteria bacterium]